MVLKIVEPECEDLFTGENCTITWFDDNTVGLHVFSSFVIFVYSVLFICYMYVNSLDEERKKFSRRNKLMLSCAACCVCQVIFAITGMGMESTLRKPKGRASLIFFALFICALGEVVKNLSFMLLTSSSNVLAKRGRLDVIIESRLVKAIVIPWYLFIANGVMILLIYLKYERFVEDRTRPFRIIMGLGAVYAILGSLTIWFSLRKVVSQLGSAISNNAAYVAQNESSGNELAALLVKLRRMNCFLLVGTPLLVGAAFILIFTNALQSPEIFLGNVVFVFLNNSIGLVVLLAVLWPKKQATSSKASKGTKNATVALASRSIQDTGFAQTSESI